MRFIGRIPKWVRPGEIVPVDSITGFIEENKKMAQKSIPVTQQQVEMITQEVKKTLAEYLNEEIDIRVRDEVRKEVKRVFREMGRY